MYYKLCRRLEQREGSIFVYPPIIFCIWFRPMATYFSSKKSRQKNFLRAPWPQNKFGASRDARCGIRAVDQVHPWTCPYRHAAHVQIRSRRICLIRMTSRDGGNAEGLSEQSLPMLKRAKNYIHVIFALPLPHIPARLYGGENHDRTTNLA